MDLSQYSDEQLKALAGLGGDANNDLSSYSDEDLMKVAGVQPEKGYLESAAQGGGSAIAKRGIGMMQLAEDVGVPVHKLFGVDKAAFDKAASNATKAENAAAQGTGITGGLTGIIADPVNFMLPSGGAIQGGNMLQKMVAAGKLGAKYGAVSGATSALEEGQGRIEATGMGAGLGAAFGAAVPPIAAGLKATVVNPIKNLASGYMDKAILNEAVKTGELVKSNLSPALQKVYDRFRADFPDDAEFAKALNSYASKQGQTLLEAGGGRVANLAEGAAQFPSGGAKTGEFFKDATLQAPEKIKATVAKNISPNTQYYETLDDMVKKGREAAKPLYNDAFKFNQSVDSPVISKILDTPEGKKALGEAVENVRNEMSLVAKPDPELTALAKELSDIGLMDSQKGGVAKGLKLKALDEVKKAFDITIKKAIRDGDAGQITRIGNLKRGLVAEIDNLDKTGLYAKARATSGDYLSNKEAMDAGKSILTDDAELIAKRFAGMGKTEKESYKVGVVKAIRDKIESTADGRNVASLFDKPATRKKLESILGSKEYTRLLDDAFATDNLFKLRNQIVGNSRTAQRQIASGEFDDIGNEIVKDVIEHGAKGAAYKKAISLMKAKFQGLSDKTAEEVANILYEQDPKKKYQIVKALTNQMNNSGDKLRSTQAAQKLQAYFTLDGAMKAVKQKGAELLTNQSGVASNP